MCLDQPASPDRWATLSFVCAVSLHETATVLAPHLRDDLALKWPNDLLLDGAKVAGLLVEARGRSVVCGFGVNVAHAPHEALYPTTSFRVRGATFDAQALLETLAGRFAAALAIWDRGQGFPTIRQRWLAAASGLGGPITARLADRVLHGTFEALDDRGQLLLRASDGTATAVAAGDVFLPRPRKAVA